MEGKERERDRIRCYMIVIVVPSLDGIFSPRNDCQYHITSVLAVGFDFLRLP